MVKSAKAFIFMHTNFRTHMIVCSSAYTQQIGLVPAFNFTYYVLNKLWQRDPKAFTSRRDETIFDENLFSSYQPTIFKTTMQQA